MGNNLELEVESSGERLDVYLAARVPELSRSRLQRLIALGRITVDGVVMSPASRVRAGQRLMLMVPDSAPTRLKPQPLPLDIVYEDQDLLVVDKPAGLAVHPAPGHTDGTLANALLARHPAMEEVGDVMRPGIVHRLDKDTSGLLVMARNQRAYSLLAAQFKERRVTKVYLALAHGHVEPYEAIIDAPIGRHPRHRNRMAVSDSGRESTTRYNVLRRYTGHTFLEARPKTGRTHQIRVHMASVGHPLVGDSTYGRPHPRLERHFLHAHVLGFTHPSTGERVELKSDLPPELSEFLDSLT